MENFVQGIIKWVVYICQILAIIVISTGIVRSMIIYVKDALFGLEASEAIKYSRMELGHSFSLGLGFLIGASILHTAIAPNWDDIGKLAAIIAIRTILNYFLLLDIGKASRMPLGSPSENDEAGNQNKDSRPSSS